MRLGVSGKGEFPEMRAWKTSIRSEEILFVEGGVWERARSV